MLASKRSVNIKHIRKITIVNVALRMNSWQYTSVLELLWTRRILVAVGAAVVRNVPRPVRLIQFRNVRGHNFEYMHDKSDTCSKLGTYACIIRNSDNPSNGLFGRVEYGTNLIRLNAM